MMINKEEVNIIYEGNTEKKFIEWLNKNFDSNYILHGHNAESGSNIVKKYIQTKRSNDPQRIIVMYDLDNVKNIDVIKGLFAEHYIDISDDSLYYIDSEIETFLLYMKSGKVLKHDRDIIIGMRKYYGIIEYRKTEKQLKQIMKQLDRDEFIRCISNMKHNSFTNYNVLFNTLFVIPAVKILKG